MPQEAGIFKPHFIDKLKLTGFPEDMQLLLILFIVTFSQVLVSTPEEIWGLERNQSCGFCGDTLGTLGSGISGLGGTKGRGGKQKAEGLDMEPSEKGLGEQHHFAPSVFSSRF